MKRRGIIGTWTALTKLYLTLMATLPAALAYLAAPSGQRPAALPALVIGVFISASGAAALNQSTERRSDRKMNRTRHRPLPAGDVSATTVFLLGIAMVAAGAGTLAIFFNLLASLLTLAAAVIYWLIYTPLKRVTPWCTEIGAISGAIPCLIGWAAAEGTLSPFAWLLFAILFLWQMPHFHPIAWRHREDYARAGLRMRAVIKPGGNEAANHSIIYAILVTATTVFPAFMGETGLITLAIAVILGIAFIHRTLRFRFAPDRDLAARQLFHFSLIYLPAMLAVLTADRYFQRLLGS